MEISANVMSLLWEKLSTSCVCVCLWNEWNSLKSLPFHFNILVGVFARPPLALRSSRCVPRTIDPYANVDVLCGPGPPLPQLPPTCLRWRLSIVLWIALFGFIRTRAEDAASCTHALHIHIRGTAHIFHLAHECLWAIYVLRDLHISRSMLQC